MSLTTQEKQAAIKLKTIALSKAFSNSGKPGTTKRIDFLELLNTSMLFSAVRRDELFDDYGIGQRTVDSCFEMGDAESVIAGLIHKAQTNSVLLSAMRQNHGQGVVCKWMSQYQCIQETLF